MIRMINLNKNQILDFNMRPEAEILLNCAQTAIDSQSAERIKMLLQQQQQQQREQIDWPYLLRIANWHGMMPLLYWNLNAASPEAVPKEVLDQLRNHFHNNAQANLFLIGELLKLLNLFETHGIPAIPLKGPVLAASVYGSFALRQFYDLDILIYNKKDVPRAKELLISQKYRPQLQLTRAQEAALIRSQCEHHLMRDDVKVMVDLHWGIAPTFFSFPLNPQHLWKRLEPISFVGNTILTIVPEDLLLILCVHGTKHGWDRLCYICDIAELVRAHKDKELDWSRTIAWAVKLGSERMLLLGLFLASDLLGVTLPEEVWRRTQADPMVKSLAVQAYKRLFQEHKSPLTFVERCLFHLRARERLRDRLRYCFRLAIIPFPIDWEVLPLPDPIFFLHYVIQPIRMLGKHWLDFLKILLRSSRVNS